MSIQYLKAYFRGNDIVEVNISKSFSNRNLLRFRLYEGKEFVKELPLLSRSESNSSNIYSLSLAGYQFTLGNEYTIATEGNFFIPIDLSYYAKQKEFDEKYRYDGQLGAAYTPSSTTFTVFSPFASSIILRIKRKGKKEAEAYMMEKDREKGIFRITLSGDFDCAEYLYDARIFGQEYQVPDPYSFALSSNSRTSFVIDKEKAYQVRLHEEDLPPFEDKTKAVLYECHVRDMTSLTDVKDKGTFAALFKEGLQTEDGLPIGLDYLSSLGVTHIQLQPVLDYQSVDEDDSEKSYNWGYDPEFFFAPEGSLSTDPSSPYQRVLELRTLASKLHQRGMRVVYDVVYNHVFSQDYNALNILVPGYYFRYTDDGYLSNGTGCGNDFESRRYMARKLILDSLSHLIDFYGADGFRFDLMGILDIETIQEAYQKLSREKSGLLFYGEGWDLMTSLPYDKKASYYNADKMPFASFFNDRFRDVVKGKTNESELGVSGYLLGDTNYRDGFKHVMLGSSVPLSFSPLFLNPSQSVNYVECHDNHTLYDKIRAARWDDTEEEIQRRIKMIDVAVLMASGIPFFHAGQEIGLSKHGIGNSYNSGDDINGFDYEVLQKNVELYHFFQDAISFKKNFIQEAGRGYKDINDHISFEDLEKGALKINYDFEDFTLFLIFNPSKESFMYSFDDYVRLVFSNAGIIGKSQIYIKLAIINGLSVSMYEVQKREKVQESEVKIG